MELQALLAAAAAAAVPRLQLQPAAGTSSTAGSSSLPICVIEACDRCSRAASTLQQHPYAAAAAEFLPARVVKACGQIHKRC